MGFAVWDMGWEFFFSQAVMARLRLAAMSAVALLEPKLTLSDRGPAGQAVVGSRSGQPTAERGGPMSGMRRREFISLLGRAAADAARCAGFRGGGRSDVVWTKLSRPAAARRRLRRQDSARSEASRHPGRAADQVRSGRQSDHREGTRHRNAADAARPRRRGDRVRHLRGLPSGTRRMD